MNFKSALLALALLCHTAKATDEAEENHTQLGPVLFPQDEKNVSDFSPTTETDVNEKSSSWNTGKKIFFFGNSGNYSDSIVVEANFTASNDSITGDRNHTVHRSLSPETDKSDLYVSQHYAADPEIETEDDKKLSHFSLGSFIPSLPKPFLKLPNWLRKKVVVTRTVYVKETLHSVVYPSCVVMQNVHSICDGTLITVAPTRPIPTKPMPTASIWGDFDEGQEAAELPASKEDIRPTATASAVLPTSTDIGTDIDEFYYDRQAGGNTDHPDFDYANVVEEQSTKATPTLPKKLDSIEDAAANIDGKSGLSSLLRPEIKFVTEYKTITSTKYFVNYGHTATVIAQNCLPANLNMPACRNYPFEIRPTLTFYSSRTATPASQTFEQPKKESIVQSPTTKNAWPTKTIAPPTTEGAAKKPFFATPPAAAVIQHPEIRLPTRLELMNNAIDRIRQKVRVIARNDLRRLVAAGFQYGDSLQQITHPEYADPFPQITYPISFLVPNYHA